MRNKKVSRAVLDRAGKAGYDAFWTDYGRRPNKRTWRVIAKAILQVFMKKEKPCKPLLK